MKRFSTIAAATWLLMSTTAYAQSATIRIELSAQLEVRNPETPREPVGPLPLVREQLRTVIDGQHATSELTQVFSNRSGARLEGRYALQPGIDARVSGFAYYIGEERVEGEVLERQAARQVYDTITTQRRDPAILEQTAAGEYTFRVFPIEPNEDKRLEITFGQWLRRRGNDVTYRAPLASPDADAVVILRDPRARHVRSPSHRLDVERIEGGVRIRTRGALDERGEIELRWEIEEAPWQASAWVHQDEGHDGYFLLAVAAPEGFEDRVSAKDVTLVLDRSGSMSGEALVNARQAASDVIRRLGPDDRLNVVAFDDDVEPLYYRPRSADVEVRADALEFVSRLRPGGGTDIAFALGRSLEAQHDRAGRPRVVIFLTDGQSAVGPALELAQADRRDVRVFTVGVGSGVNQALLGRLAALKRGSFTYIDRPSRIEAEVGHLYAQIAQPLLVDVSLDVEGAVASRIYPRSIPDLFVDDELVVSGRFRGDGPVRFVVRGTLGGRAVEMRTTAAPDASGRRGWVGRRWAQARVDDLLEKIQLDGERPEVRAEVVSLALAYDFVTPYTAFLAIPEREVTAAARGTLDAARAQRGAAQSRHADAVALSSTGGDAPEAEPVYAMEESASMPSGAPLASRAGCASCTVGAARPTPRALVGLPLLAIAIGWRLRRRR